MEVGFEFLSSLLSISNFLRYTAKYFKSSYYSYSFIFTLALTEKKYNGKYLSTFLTGKPRFCEYLKKNSSKTGNALFYYFFCGFWFLDKILKIYEYVKRRRNNSFVEFHKKLSQKIHAYVFHTILCKT